MEIIIFLGITGVLLLISALGRQYAMVGMLGGLGLVMMALSVMTSGLQMVVGELRNTSVANLTNITTSYANISGTFSGLSYLDVMLAIVFGGAGVLIFIKSITGAKL